MSEYGPGHTFGTAAELDKERIIHALNGQLAVDEDEQGFIYDNAPKDQCDAFILEKFDNMVYQCKELAASGRAMERVINEEGLGNWLPRFFAYMAEESQKFNDYLYEFEKIELAEEAEEALED